MVVSATAAGSVAASSSSPIASKYVAEKVAAGAREKALRMLKSGGVVLDAVGLELFQSGDEACASDNYAAATARYLEALAMFRSKPAPAKPSPSPSSSPRWRKEAEFSGLACACAHCGRAQPERPPSVPWTGGGEPSDSLRCFSCPRCQMKYCSDDCRARAWQCGHSVSCGLALPTPSSVAASDFGSVVALLEEFGLAHSELAAHAIRRMVRMLESTRHSSESGAAAKPAHAVESGAAKPPMSAQRGARKPAMPAERRGPSSSSAATAAAAAAATAAAATAAGRSAAGGSTKGWTVDSGGDVPWSDTLGRSIRSTLGAMREHRAASDVQQLSCALLTHASLLGGRTVAIESGSVGAVVRCLATHPHPRPGDARSDSNPDPEP